MFCCFCVCTQMCTRVHKCAQCHIFCAQCFDRCRNVVHSKITWESHSERCDICVQMCDTFCARCDIFCDTLLNFCYFLRKKVCTCVLLTKKCRQRRIQGEGGEETFFGRKNTTFHNWLNRRNMFLVKITWDRLFWEVWHLCAKVWHFCARCDKKWWHITKKWRKLV